MLPLEARLTVPLFKAELKETRPPPPGAVTMGPLMVSVVPEAA